MRYPSEATPVVFLAFNRPETTKRTFEAIRAAKPRRLLLIADGARVDKPQEAEKCDAVRAILNDVDWNCEVSKNFSDYNMGCRLRVASGITWAFELVDRAIILEDDCVPSPSFFRYSAELLDRYEHDNRVMMISGDNHLFGRMKVSDSYYFSRYPHIWGWATWRRAWAKYDLTMSRWPEIKDKKLFHQYLTTRSERRRWDAIFQKVYDGKVDTWDYQWVYSIWLNSGLSIAPARNLVRNTGFNAAATHTTRDSIYSSLMAEELNLPLAHPDTVLAHSGMDALEAKLATKRARALYLLKSRLAKNSPEN